MRTWMTLLFLAFMVSAVHAADKPAATDKAASAEPAAQAAQPEPARTTKHKTKRLPRGDLRHCLALKDNAAIIKCAETRR